MAPKTLAALLVCLATSSGGCAAHRPADLPQGPAAVATAGSSAALAPKPPVALEEYFKIRRVGGRVSFSFDEKLVAFLSSEGGRLDIWVHPLVGGPDRGASGPAGEGGGQGRWQATQVTHVDGAISSLAFSPTRDVLAFDADHGGDELPHLYLTDSNGTAPRDIVPDLPQGRRTALVEWAPDGKTFMFLSNARDEKAMDLYEYDLAAGKATMVWRSDGTTELAAISHDHRLFVASEQHSDVDNDLYLVRRGESGKGERLTPHPGAVRFGAQYLSFDNRTLYFTSDAGGEFTALRALDLATHVTTTVLRDDWDVDAAGASSTGRYTFTSTNADGSPRLVVTDEKSGAVVPLPAPPAGGAWDASEELDGPAVLGFSRSDRYLAVMLRSDKAPAAPYALDLSAGRAIPLADPLPASLKDRAMVPGTSVRVPSFDGKPVPAFLHVPEGPGPFPAVIDVHGGPNSQKPREFSRMNQYLLSKGYVVLEPNVRGSTGYGKTWASLDNLDLGGAPLQDIVACKTYLVDHAHVAADKVVVMGGSYGGYMALAAATFTSDTFAANVDYFGISDIKSLVEGFPPYWLVASPLIHQKWGDPANPAHARYQHDRSPLYFADRVTRPLLVVQGENDPRVKADQSERIVAALRQRHVPVHYLLLKGEGHGFTKNESRLEAYGLTDRFLDHYVLGDANVKVE
jgi:dipeptidyl aminopeptidase/acylaminoacyl peptidase